MFRKSYSYSSVSEQQSSGCCRGSCRCLTRIPYATLIATVLCCTGVGIFLGSFYRGISLTLRTFQEVFMFQFDWLIDLHIVFIIVGSVMGAFSLILLLVGFLATGATREKEFTVDSNLELVDEFHVLFSWDSHIFWSWSGCWCLFHLFL
ncbi:neuronal membrane glycoprotein M6-a [Caerostris extrusa]|uniref:Neuronal membrane glycoprotein M6-a n=1 Tax=Caerostris extrusa TaxID=172846 RepID=A0AAV4RIJ3_CAEEX|nr:neuronal membrane glycoprotein M6-a [Caerostris extrusa]